MRTCCTQVRYHSHWGADTRALVERSLFENVTTTSARVCRCPVHDIDWTSQSFAKGTRARETPQQPPSMHSSRIGDSRQHLQHRKASSAGTYLKHGDGVGPTKERSCRLRCHLRTKHKRQFEILNVRTRLRTSAEGKCSIRCDGMGAGAGEVLAELGPTAHGAWGRPAYCRLKAEPLLLCEHLKAAPARKS